jgi:uncharacterized protein YciI
MPSWNEYKNTAKGRGALAMELYIVESKLVATPDEMLKHLPAHLEYQKQMEAEGKLFLAGPLSDPSGKEMSGNGMIVYKVATMKEAVQIAENDPMHLANIKEFTVRSWLVNEGALSFSLNLSKQQVVIL